MRLKAIADHNRVVRLEDWNGLDLTGTNDMQSILAAAMTQATTAKYPVIGPSGTLLIGTTVQLLAPLIGPAWPRGSLNARLRLVPGMTDGTPILEKVLANGFHLENVMLGTTAASPGAAANAIGVKLGTVGDGGVGGVGTASCYGVLQNVAINGLAVGFEIQGWSSEFLNLTAYNCGLGLRAEFINNCVLDLVCGGCAQGFTIANTGVLSVIRFGDEGQYGTAASTIEASREITFITYRCEQAGRTAPWLTAGSSLPNKVYGLRILSGGFGVTAPGVPEISLDYVDGWEINGRHLTTTTNRRAVQTTVNTRNNSRIAPSLAASYPFVPQSAVAAITDNRRDFSHPVELFNANPFMDGVRFGCYNLVAAADSGAVTLTEETTIYRTGKSSLKVATTTAGTYQRAEFRYNDDWVAALAGQVITFAAWIKTPTETDIKGEETADGTTIYPALAIINAAGATIGSTSNGYALRDGWTFMHCTATVPVAATEIRVGAYIHNGGATNTAIGDHIHIDFMGIAAGDVWEQIYEGNFVQSQLCTGSFLGGRALWRLTQAAAATLIADTTQVFKTGDTIEYTDPTAGGVKGITCTTPGAGGTAVFKAFSVIAA